MKNYKKKDILYDMKLNIHANKFFTNRFWVPICDKLFLHTRSGYGNGLGTWRYKCSEEDENKIINFVNDNKEDVEAYLAAEKIIANNNVIYERDFTKL